MVVLFISDWETRVVRTYTTGWFNKNGTLATMLLVVRGDIKSSWNKEPDTSFWCEPSDMVTVQRHIFLSLILLIVPTPQTRIIMRSLLQEMDLSP